MTVPHLRDAREQEGEDVQAPTVGIAAALAEEDVTSPTDSRVREGMEAHREWCKEREQRRRARETATEEQAHLTAYITDDGEDKR